jgi:hypothetical protein
MHFDLTLCTLTLPSKQFPFAMNIEQCMFDNLILFVHFQLRKTTLPTIRQHIHTRILLSFYSRPVRFADSSLDWSTILDPHHQQYPGVVDHY